MKEITKFYLLADATGLYLTPPYTSKVGLLDDFGIGDGETVVEIDNTVNPTEFSCLRWKAIARCPECGARLEFIETIGHELNDGDYFTPNSYVIDYYVYRCRECGEYFKTNFQL